MKQWEWAGWGACLVQLGTLPCAMAQADVFTLGEITITAPGDQAELAGSSVLTQQALREQNQDTVGTALNLAAGVHSAYAGARGEQVFYVRGFDRLQVPVYIDGIPTYVPYDGRIDLGHFTTYDLSRIEVAKGFSSLIYGPNALGGAINLITRRPTRAFEGEVGGGIGLSDDGGLDNHRVHANLGGKHESWWFQAGVSRLKTESFELPSGFRPTNVQQGEGQRENSRHKDDKLSLKLALTPNAGDEYVFGYVRQQGEKGQPTYAGELPLSGSGSGSRRRWWEWPQWDKTSYYFSSSTELGEHVIRTRLYHDVFENTLVGYDYANGVVGGVSSGFPSRYDDDSTGLSLEGDFALGSRNLLRVAYHFKDDVHRSSDDGTPWTHFKDRTQALSFEDTLTLADGLTLVGGVSYNQRKSLSTRNYGTNAGSPSTPSLYDEPGGDDSAVNYQLGLFRQVGAGGQVRLSFASRSRFATMMERYSTRFGTVIPNPDLKAERARHYELGYSGPLAGGWLLDAAVFRSDVRDSIQNVTIAQQGDCTSSACEQPQNVARARHVGLELGLQGEVGPIEVMGNYTWLRRKNLSAPDVRPTDTPRHKLFASVGWSHGPWKLTGNVEAASQRYSSSNGQQVAHGFAVYGFKAGYTLGSGMQIEAGVRNLFDRLYAYSEGYPMAGRNYFVNINVPF
ncbi:TonB-dependent receptor [Corticibacter populi]|uniref:TonB-dependent receptor n=1 Tax=Corticibacter populi TaxID=1550736 RepID=A0A3M6QMD4_9BURK|nr:TonB-dependent receptor [Corticibacter populi]RMX04217.1 TonB-dependent receptor [Corticibacter populi]RZS33247.1 iron complex outermembrane receptor protein [Corticibacter populi]